ncbi:hypothetical protein ACWGQT_07375 [Streptomyces yangpuensis]
MAVITCDNPHAEDYDPNSSNNTPEATAAHMATHTVRFEGAVLRLRERNGYDDSDFYATVWNEEAQAVEEVYYATTRGWTYHNGAHIDATHDVIEKAVAHTAALLLADWERSYNERIEKGMTASTTVKGETLTGVIAWVGEAKAFTSWEARYGAPRKRYGLKIEGRSKFVFADADKLHDVVRTPWTAEDRADMTARAEYRARTDYAQATALADKRAAEAPAVVDSRDADADGWMLYAVGRDGMDDGDAGDIAQHLVDGDAVAYSVDGTKASGAPVDPRTVGIPRALSAVQRGALRQGLRIEHDGKGAVRLSLGEMCMVLRPVDDGPLAGPVAPAAAETPAPAVAAPQRPVERHVGALAEDLAAKGVRAAVEALGADGHALATVTNIVGDWSTKGVFVAPGGSRHEERAGVLVQFYADGYTYEAHKVSATRREARRAARNEALDGCARTLRAAGWSVMHREHKTTRTRCVDALHAWPPVG